MDESLAANPILQPMCVITCKPLTHVTDRNVGASGNHSARTRVYIARLFARAWVSCAGCHLPLHSGIAANDKQERKWRNNPTT